MKVTNGQLKPASIIITAENEKPMTTPSTP